jgi:hypothetical protein
MNDLNFSECKFNGEMVSYMYGELSSEETSVFELHLVDCSACTDEFAAISSSRYEVYDWKKLEFDPLETPNFDVPLGVGTGASWSDRIRVVFARGWAVPAFSLAAIAIVSVVATGLIWQRSGNIELASRTFYPVPVNDEISVPAETEVATTTVDKLDELTVKDRVSKSKRSTPRTFDSEPVKATRVRPVEVKQTTAKNEKKAVPSLNEYADDEEDTSLRLAELLEDIGSR